MENEENITVQPQTVPSQEPKGMGQESADQVAAIPDTIYDILENTADTESPDPSEDSDTPEKEDPDQPTEAKESKNLSQAESEIEKMIREVGADTLLQIIKDNRNAAIRQIISEVEASRDHPIPSGSRAPSSCTSIFDLAALA